MAHHPADLSNTELRDLLDAAATEAERAGIKVSVTVLDRGGHLLGFAVATAAAATLSLA